MKDTYSARLRGCLAIPVKLVGFICLVLLICVGLFVGSLFVYRSIPLIYPAPTGSHDVGRRFYDWIDGKRVDPLADQAGVQRELLIWVWYPTLKQPGMSPAAYLPPAWGKAREASRGVSVLMEYNFARMLSHSYTDSPLAGSDAPYPVLIMEPGMGPVPADYTVMAEELASNGYVVVGINPTYTSSMIAFPDGRVVANTVKGSIRDDASLATADKDGNRIMQVWADDVSYVMDQLANVNADPASPFYGHLDLAHMGVFGHSFGGATAFYVCQRDPRCKAGANMDGSAFSIELNETEPQPFLVMSEDYTAGCGDNCAALRQMFAHVKDGAAYLLEVSGAQHFNFCDLPQRQIPSVRPFFNAMGVTGTIDPQRGERIADVYLLAFFDQYLRNIDSPLLTGPSGTYPEVHISMH